MVGCYTGTRLVKTIKMAMARLRALPNEMSFSCFLYSGGGVPGVSIIESAVSLFSA